MKKTTKWLVIFFAVILTGLLSCVLLVVWIDPLFQYHKPLEWFPYQIDNQNYHDAGMAKTMDYDTIIMGSSVAANFNGDWFDEDFGADSIKLIQNGAYPRDYKYLFDCVDLSSNRIDRVFWTIEPIVFVESDTVAFPIVEYLYDNNPFNDGEYWVNKDILVEYIIKPMFDKSDKTYIKDVYETHSVLWYGRDIAMQTISREEASSEWLSEDAYYDIASKSFEDNIAPIIENHPNTEFYICMVPYSIMRWYHFKQTGELDAIMGNYKNVIQRLLGYENVHVYFFADDTDIILDMDRYADWIHYDVDTNYMMEQAMKNGENEITLEDYEERINNFRNYLYSYDYEAEFDK